MKHWDKFWGSYKALREIFEIRNSVFCKKEHTDLAEKMFNECLVDLRDNVTKLVEEINQPTG